MTAIEPDWDELDDEMEAYDDGEAEMILSPVGQAAEQLRLVLEDETRLARTGGLTAFADAIKAKQQALTAFTNAMDGASPVADDTAEADRAAVQRLIAMADENAQVLDAVRSTIADLAGRLRTALTSSSDPGTYGPSGRGPRHALAAQVDTRA